MLTTWLKCALWGSRFPPTLCQWCGRGRSRYYWIKDLTVTRSCFCWFPSPLESATFWCPWPGLCSRVDQTGRRWRTREKKQFLDKQCNPMYVQGVRTIMKSDSTGPQGFGRSWPDGPDVGGLHRFTNTARTWWGHGPRLVCLMLRHS